MRCRAFIPWLKPWAFTRGFSKYSKRKTTVSAGGKTVLEFDTGRSTHDSKISLTVLRYQGGEPAVISGVKLEKIG